MTKQKLVIPTEADRQSVILSEAQRSRRTCFSPVRQQLLTRFRNLVLPRFGSAQLQLCQLQPSSRAASAAEVRFLKTKAIPFLLAATLLTGCKVIPPPKPLNQLTTTEQAGHIVFQQNCARCHDDREGAALQGPTMLGIYKNPYLPSGAPANDDRIRNVILHGRGMMPGLGNTITDSQIDDLLAYLKTL